MLGADARSVGFIQKPDSFRISKGFLNELSRSHTTVRYNTPERVFHAPQVEVITHSFISEDRIRAKHRVYLGNRRKLESRVCTECEFVRKDALVTLGWPHHDHKIETKISNLFEY